MLSQNSSQFELENQFILRMPTIKDENGNAKPHPSAVQLREALSKVNSPDSTAAIASNNETDNIKDRLFIELNTETRKGRIKFDNEIFEARLVDLPCIVESLKTVDRKTFFKTNDICQMLICKTKDDPWSSSDEEASKKKDKKRQSESGNNLTTSTSTATTNNAKKYQWPHGIAPPLKNVRRKRFRKVAKKKMIDYVEIEKEVKQLFRADREAVKVDYEVVLVDGELEDENIDDENKNSLNNDEDFDDSSQEDETNGHRIMMGTECSNTGTGYLDSNTDNLNSNNNTAAGSIKLKKIVKSNNQVEESNMSSVMDDDDSSMMINSSSKLKLKRNQTDVEDNNEDGEATNMNPTNFDEISNDNSNFASSKATVKRTGFKNLFVEQVIGDLSSSEEEDDENKNDDEDDEDETKNKKSSSSFKFNLNRNSVHTASKDSENDESKLDASNVNPPVTAGEESVSNFDEFCNDDSSNLDRKTLKLSEAKAKSPSKNLDLDATSSSSNEDEDDENDENNNGEDETGEKTKDNSKNFPSSLSSSPTSETSEIKTNKTELQSKLDKLMDELQKIKEERRKREIEINPINNPVLKAHLSSRLNNLIEEEKKKINEIEEIKTLLND